MIEAVEWTYDLLNTSFIVMLIKRKNMEWHAIYEGHETINGNMCDSRVIRVEAAYKSQKCEIRNFDHPLRM